MMPLPLVIAALGLSVCPISGTFDNPAWHAPRAGLEDKAKGLPTAVYWIVNPEPNAGEVARLQKSMASVLASRQAHERVRLFVLVYANKAPAPETTPRDFCAMLSMPDCREVRVEAIGATCTAAANPAGGTVVIARLVGEWYRHPILGELSRLTQAFVALTIKRRRGNTRYVRRDLVNFNEQLWLKSIAYQVLLQLGVTRAIFLDNDTVARKSLAGLLRTPLGDGYFAAFVKHCLTDNVYYADNIKADHGLVRSLGFVDAEAQSVNAGVFVLDLRRACAGAAHDRILQVMRAVAVDGAPLFDNLAALTDQPSILIGWAHNTTYVDARWNCRRTKSIYRRCFIVHDKTFRWPPPASRTAALPPPA